MFLSRKTSKAALSWIYIFFFRINHSYSIVFESVPMRIGKDNISNVKIKVYALVVFSSRKPYSAIKSFLNFTFDTKVFNFLKECT